MKLPSMFLILHNVVQNLTRRSSDLNFRGMQLSHTKQFMQFVQGNRLTELKRKHSDENELMQMDFDKRKDEAQQSGDTAAVNQIQMESYGAMNNLQSRQSSEEQQMVQEAKNKEIPLDMEIELNNVQNQVVKADLDSYQKTLDNALKGNGLG